MRDKRYMRKKRGRLFEKKARSKLREKLSATSRKAGANANSGGHKLYPLLSY